MTQLDGPRFGPASKRPARALVVLLHGLGADGHDLIDLAPQWSRGLPDALFVSPHAPDPHDLAAEPGGHGRQWFSLADRATARMAAGAAAAAGTLAGFVEAELTRARLPPEALALVGFSQGAMMALFVGLRRRPPPAAIVAYSGVLLQPETLGAGPFPPVLLVHGEADQVVPVAATRAADAALRRLGVAVQTEIAPGLGHGIDAGGLASGGLFLQRGLQRFMTEQ